MNFCNNAKLTKFLLKELPYHRVNIPYAYSQFSDFLNPCLLHKNILIDSLVFMISICLASMITMITVINIDVDHNYYAKKYVEDNILLCHSPWF